MKKNHSFSPRLAQAIGEIEQDNVHGAGYLALKCLELTAEAAAEYVKSARQPDDLGQFLKTLAGRLAGCQSAMSAIPNLLARVLDKFFTACGTHPAAAPRSAEMLRQIADSEKARLEHDLETLAGKGAAFLREKIPGGGHIVTISHSRAVWSVLKALAGHGVQVTVSESRPLNEGVELARQLAGEKIAVRLIPDCLLGLATGEADAALIGADSLTPGGDVVNKAGTRLLALAAREDGVPLYCCAETLKIMSSEPEPGPAFPVQRRRPAEEIVARPPEQVEVLNLYFELTPWELISGYITERGILDRKYLRTLSIEMEEIVEKNIRRE